MTLLSDIVSSRLTYSRSVNVERAVGQTGSVPSYILTQRTLEALDRIVTALEHDGAPHAWTVTGPYGSGKSAFALFLAGLFSPTESEAHGATITVLRSRSSDLAARIDGIRERYCQERGSGFIVATATAEREPAAKTIARALLSGFEVYRRRPGRPPRVVIDLRRLAGSSEPDPREVVSAFAALTHWAPVLLLLDEFGKNLEFAADDPAIGDLYVLQQLAESLVGPEAVPGAMVTLQHLSFADYAFGLPAERLREWNKIQGRFEDISFLEADDQTAQLIAEALQRSTEGHGERAVKQWAEAQVSLAGSVGIATGVAGDSDLAARCYPIQPVAVDTLAHLTSRYGQHERSLFTFLTSSEPFSLSWYLDRTLWNADSPPAFGLDLLFDYFVTNVADVPSAAAHAARWLEIRNRVVEARSVSESALRTLKTVGLLNLIGSTDGLRASPAVLEALWPDSQEDIDELVSSGVITFRAFADEYRIWEGSDFDLSAAVAAERDRSRDASVSEQVEQVLSLSPRVAQRHSHERSTLRYFEQRYVEHLPLEVEPTDPHADGVILFVFGSTQTSNSPTHQTPEGRPVVAVFTPDSVRIEEAAREAAAIAELLQNDETLREDRVARSEARIRASIAQRTLARRLQHAFDPCRADVVWWADGARREVASERDVSRILSDVCDSTYRQAPVIRNEMINRSTLTSQGAKARRILLEAMIEHPQEHQFGLEGNGPAVAIYRAIIEAGRAVDRRHRTLRMPPRGSSLHAACRHIYRRVRDADGPVDLGTIVTELTRPPYGARRGAIPLLLAVVLLAREDDIAIYQDGSFEPTLAADVFERLIKAPERFTARHVGSDGEYSEVIGTLREELEITETGTSQRWRNATLLSIIRPVLTGLRHLPEFSMRTRLVSTPSQAVRRVLTEVREPDQLLFAALPEALDVDLAEPDGPREYARLLSGALAEIRDAYETHVRRWVLERLVAALSLSAQGGGARRDPSEVPFREEARGRARPLINQILDQRLRSFLLFVANDELSDNEWIDAIALNISGKPPQAWRDDDRDIFAMRLAELVGTFERVNALYFDIRAAEGVDGLSAVRITLTSVDDDEHDRVVWVADGARPALKQIADQAIAEARARAGERGAGSLLAVLAAKVFERAPGDAQLFDPSESEDDEVGIA